MRWKKYFWPPACMETAHSGVVEEEGAFSITQSKKGAFPKLAKGQFGMGKLYVFLSSALSRLGGPRIKVCAVIVVAFRGKLIDVFDSRLTAAGEAKVSVYCSNQPIRSSGIGSLIDAL